MRIGNTFDTMNHRAKKIDLGTWYDHPDKMGFARPQGRSHPVALIF